MRDFFFEIPLFWLVTDFNKLLGGMWMDNPHVLLEYERLRNNKISLFHLVTGFSEVCGGMWIRIRIISWDSQGYKVSRFELLTRPCYNLVL